jgi:hypothetical protein
MGTIGKLAGAAAQRIDSFQRIVEVTEMTEMRRFSRISVIRTPA